MLTNSTHWFTKLYYCTIIVYSPLYHHPHLRHTHMLALLPCACLCCIAGLVPQWRCHVRPCRACSRRHTACYTHPTTLQRWPCQCRVRWGRPGEWGTACEMARLSISSCEMRERKEWGGGGDGVECDYGKARAGAMVRWNKSESSEIEEDHSSEGLTGTCGRAKHGKGSQVA